jgi:hypothetical protein
MSDILNVIQRWEALGLLYGLPLWEKEELSQVYDNAARLILHEESKNIPKKIYENLNEVTFPILRRLYRRVGLNFDIEILMSKLLEELHNNPKLSILPSPKVSSQEEINIETDKYNKLTKFCVEFADKYEDSETVKNQFSDEDYEERVDKLLNTVKDVLLNKNITSFIDRTSTDWKIILSDKKSSKMNTRYWNQKISKELLTSVLSDTNKGI